MRKRNAGKIRQKATRMITALQGFVEGKRAWDLGSRDEKERQSLSCLKVRPMLLFTLFSIGALGIRLR